LTIGSRVIYDGTVCAVIAIAGDRATAQPQVSGRAMSVRIASLLAAPGSTPLDATLAVPVGAVGPALARLSDGEMTAVCERSAHLREMLPGYPAGSVERALPGEPRAAYAAGVSLMERYRAKAAELGVGVTSLRRSTSAFEAEGQAGLIDARHQRASGPLRGIDPRWLDVLRAVLDEHVGASRPTQELLLDRVNARASSSTGPGWSRSAGRASRRSGS
jgi:hypothetical protein